MPVCGQWWALKFRCVDLELNPSDYIAIFPELLTTHDQLVQSLYKTDLRISFDYS